MPKFDNVTDSDLRSKLEQAHKHLRAGEPTDAVKVLSDTFLGMLGDRPDLLGTVAPGARMQMPLWMRWPRLGADLDPESVKAGEPRIEFKRERFAMSEAIMYYEFTVDTAIDQGF